MEPQQNQSAPVSPTTMLGTDLASPNQTQNSNGHKKIGPIIAILVIVIIVVAIILYIFASKVNNQIVPLNSDTASADRRIVPPTEPGQTSALEVRAVTNTADDIQSLQNDLDQSTLNVDAQKL